MKVRLIVCFLSIWTFHRAVSSLKYSHFGDCYYFDSDSYGESNLTLVCDYTTRQNTFFENELSICANQHEAPVECCKLGYLPKWIGTINFTDCQQPQIPDHMFEIYYRVHTLDMSDMGMATEQLKFLAHATPLVNINLSHNAIDQIPENMFSNSKQIAKVDFSFNKINRFDSDAFSADNRITVLNLSFNNISELAVKSFQRLTMLQHLLLSNNRIVEVPSFLFHKTEHLIELDLSCNQIKTIDNFAFSGDINLKRLNLSHNHLTTLTKKTLGNHSELTHLDVSHNQIPVLKAETFVNVTKLQYLNISHNKLSEIVFGLFSTLMDLQQLDLSVNELEKLNADVLPRSNQLKSISIGYNQLRELPITIEDIPNAKIVGIDTNKFNCSYIEQIFLQFTWKHFDSFTTRINCSSNSEEIESVSNLGTTLTTTTLASDLPPTESTSTSTPAPASKKEVVLDRSTEKIEVSKENELPTQNRNIKEYVNHSSANIVRIASVIMDNMTWFNATCLICLVTITLTLLWFVLQMRRKERRERAFYRRCHYRPADEKLLRFQIVNAVENRSYVILVVRK